jgi:predicted MPP superfamily phosphohydrolase
MSAARFLLFVLLMVGVLGAINAQVFRWARNAFGLSAGARRGLKLVLVASIAGMVLGRVAGRLWPSAGLGFVIATASTVQLAIVIAGILLLVMDAGLLLARLAGRFLKLPVRARDAAPAPAAAAPTPALAAPRESPPSELPRRAFLTQASAGSALLIGSSSALYGALRGRYDYSVEEVAIKIPGLPRAFDGFSIAQLSDVHIGVFVGDAELAIAEELLRQAKPDLIVLTGDLLDNDPRLAPKLGRFVRRLTPLARAGVVAISGNHDYFAGVEEMSTAISGAGARILRNDAMVVGGAGAGFALLGVEDVWGRREGGGPDLERALRSLPRLGGRVAPAADLPRVLLCHNPSFFAEAAGRVALQLSGHTHGGQVNLGIRPADYLLPGGWVAGRYDRAGSALYVNRGFGTVGPPARVGAPPEVTRIILTA